MWIGARWCLGGNLPFSSPQQQLDDCSRVDLLFHLVSRPKTHRFKEITGSYPTKITIVGYDFKARRFEDLHMPAIRFPPEAFRYVGQHPEGKFDHAAAAEGERTSALEPYQADPYGCTAGGTLAEKRHQRDPFHRTPPYSLVCPEMSALLEYCGTEIFTGGLPWSPVDEDEAGGGS